MSSRSSHILASGGSKFWPFPCSSSYSSFEFNLNKASETCAPPTTLPCHDLVSLSLEPLEHDGLHCIRKLNKERDRRRIVNRISGEMGSEVGEMDSLEPCLR